MEGKLTDQHRDAVRLLAIGLDTRHLGETAKALRAETGKIWGVRTAAGLAIAYAQRLSPAEHQQMLVWAATNYASTKLQRKLVGALALRINASLFLDQLAAKLGTDPQTLSVEMKQLLARLPNVKTRAGLTTVCYLASGGYVHGLGEDDFALMRLIARGSTEKVIKSALGLPNVSAVKTRKRLLLARLSAKNSSHVALIYLRECQTPEEQALWRSQITFEWPHRGRLRQILDLLLNVEHCDASRAKLGELLGGIAERTVAVHMARLYHRLEEVRPSRVSLVTAAELHRP